MSKVAIRLHNPALVVLTVLLGGIALAISNSLFFYLFYVCLFLTVGTYVWTKAIAGRLLLDRELRNDWVQVGDKVRERFILTNTSRLGVPWVEIEDHSDLPGYQASRVEAIGGRQSRRWDARSVCRRRGLYTLGPVTLRTGDPFGVFLTQWEQPATRSFLVYPPIYELSGLTLPRGTVSGSSRSSFRTQQVTTNAATVREYLPGDSLNRLHWPSTARMGKLMVKEFDLEPSGNLWIVLDLDRNVHIGSGDEASLEYGVKLAGSLAYKVLGENKAVGLVAYGKEVAIIQPDRGLRQLRRILEALAMAQAGGYPLPRLLQAISSSLGRGMTVAVITPSADTTWIVGLADIARRGLSPVAFLIDSRSFGGVEDSAALAGELNRLNIPVYIIRQGQAFGPPASQIQLVMGRAG